ncbi:MAG: hypothetical protein KatS3mg076_1590 [Candidatus Binatia bacterium]|nr:MAG: hypothetical protein KatS3mg076_1590 [Candidatus Binatia bacterium]
MKRRILVVEDDPDIVQIVRQTLERAGYEVVLAYGGDDALRKVDRELPDLVVTDLAMPKMSGVALIKSLRENERTAHLPILAVTAHVWDEIAQAAGRVGCDAFLSKPFTTKQLLEAVEAQLSGPKPRP